MSADEAARGPQRLVVLDSWRGIAALAVALFHLPTISVLTRNPLIDNSYLFVDFFFVLSGFVIYLSYRDRLENTADLARFVFVRFGRLYPMHLFTILLLASLTLPDMIADPRGFAAEQPEYGLWPLAENLALVHSLNITGVASWNRPSWSISAEFLSYLVFALAIVAFNRAGLLVLACAGAASLAVIVTHSGSLMDVTYDYGFFRALYGFSVGAVLSAVCLDWRRARAALRSLTFAAASIIEIAAVGGLVAYVIAAGDNAWSYAAPFVCAVVVFVFSEERGLVSRLLSTAPFTAAGRISYSIYINHLLVISSAIAVFGALSQQTGARLVSLAADGEMVLGTNQLEGAVIVAAMLATLITVSMLTYRCIEMPLYAMAKRRAARQAGSGADTPLSVARTHL